MKYLKQFGLFWYHFVIGDDWRIAAGVVVGLSLIAFLTHSLHIQVWWLLPVMVVVTLFLSLWHSTRRR
jgi:hypothetical protein